MVIFDEKRERNCFIKGFAVADEYEGGGEYFGGGSGGASPQW